MWVEYTWSHSSLHSDRQIARGEERFGLNDFLTLTKDQAAQPLLLSVLKEFFREPSGSSAEGGRNGDHEDRNHF
jgi:hypothetical protein